ncbi:MAG: hypothetical protein MJZ81_09555 [Bacteroidales bacterium]|nr:hypothetical protein [Bacteroidales bacterium]
MESCKDAVSVGDRFGMLTVSEVGLREEVHGNPGHYLSVCRCKCDCGEEKLLPPSTLLSGRVTSCGCKLSSPLKVGDKSGELTVIKVGIKKGPPGNQQQYCVCRCSCGAEKEFLSTYIVQKRVKSCAGPAHAYRIMGKRYGHLEVVDPNVGTNERGKRLVKCKCHNCGGEIVLSAVSLAQKRRTDCGCLKKLMPRKKYDVFPGDVFGNLVVVSTTTERHGTSLARLAKCRCSCGKEFESTFFDLVNGLRKSCGCAGRVSNGDVFGRLTVIDNSLTSPSGMAMAKCVCSCENHTVVDVLQSSLKKGNTKSCGCLRKKHGDSHTRLYRIWKGMLDRVRHTNRDYSKWYVEKGIKVCAEWEDWLAFKSWALSNGYDESLTLDRIDSNGDYFPGNCRWSTRKEQSNNKSDNVWLEYNGETMNLAQWGERTGIHADRIGRRLKSGWSVDEALTTPVGKTRGWRSRKK